MLTAALRDPLHDRPRRASDYITQQQATDIAGWAERAYAAVRELGLPGPAPRKRRQPGRHRRRDRLVHRLRRQRRPDERRGRPDRQDTIQLTNGSTVGQHQIAHAVFNLFEFGDLAAGRLWCSSRRRQSGRPSGSRTSPYARAGPDLGAVRQHGRLRRRRLRDRRLRPSRRSRLDVHRVPERALRGGHHQARLHRRCVARPPGPAGDPYVSDVARDKRRVVRERVHRLHRRTASTGNFSHRLDQGPAAGRPSRLRRWARSPAPSRPRTSRSATSPRATSHCATSTPARATPARAIAATLALTVAHSRRHQREAVLLSRTRRARRLRRSRSPAAPPRSRCPGTRAWRAPTPTSRCRTRARTSPRTARTSRSAAR